LMSFMEVNLSNVTVRGVPLGKARAKPLPREKS
jgi:hypothetical protein